MSGHLPPDNAAVTTILADYDGQIAFGLFTSMLDPATSLPTPDPTKVTKLADLVEVDAVAVPGYMRSFPANIKNAVDLPAFQAVEGIATWAATAAPAQEVEALGWFATIATVDTVELLAFDLFDAPRTLAAPGDGLVVPFSIGAYVPSPGGPSIVAVEAAELSVSGTPPGQRGYHLHGQDRREVEKIRDALTSGQGHDERIDLRPLNSRRSSIPLLSDPGNPALAEGVQAILDRCNLLLSL